jgi:hypothetical protein
MSSRRYCAGSQRRNRMPGIGHHGMFLNVMITLFNKCEWIDFMLMNHQSRTNYCEMDGLMRFAWHHVVSDDCVNQTRSKGCDRIPASELMWPNPSGMNEPMLRGRISQTGANEHNVCSLQFDMDRLIFMCFQWQIWLCENECDNKSIRFC